MVELIDEADLLAPRLRSFTLAQVRHVLAVDPDRALETAFEQTDRLQHRRLARSRGAEQSDDLAALHLRFAAEKHADRHPVLGETTPQIAQFKSRVRHSGAPAPGTSETGRVWTECYINGKSRW